MAGQLTMTEMPQIYEVWVKVSPAVDGPGVLIQVFPERMLLSGVMNNIINWQMMEGSLAVFTGVDDISFGENSSFFSKSWIADQGIISARVTGTNPNETIYTYFLSVHLRDPEGVVIQLDPEVDNPPPPPTGP